MERNILSDIADTEDFHRTLEDMQSEKKILIFRDTRHSDTTEQFLTMLYEAVVTDENLSVTLVIDEVHELEFSKGSALYHIIEKGRGNGISLISIFQGAHEMKPRQFSMLNQSAVKLMFGISDAEDARKCVASAGLKPVAQFTELLGSLPKQTCLVTGSLEDKEGSLRPGRFVVVSIPDAD